MKRVYTGLFLLLAYFFMGPFCEATVEAKGQDHLWYNKTVLLQDPKGMVPLQNLEMRRIALLIPEHSEQFAALEEQVHRYARIDVFHYPQQERGTYAEFSDSLKWHNTVLVVVDMHRQHSSKFSAYCGWLSQHKDVLFLFTGPEPSREWQRLTEFPAAIMWTPDQDVMALKFAGMSIFGGLACTAKLEGSMGTTFPAGTGLITQASRLKYLFDWGCQIDYGNMQARIDAIMQEAIREKATPGAVVLVVHDGNVLFEKAYGHHRYDAVQPTLNTDIFDLASITKIAATTPLVMQFFDRGQIKLDHTLGDFLWEVRGRDQAGIKVRDVLLHEAGFIPYIPFYKALQAGDLSPDSTSTHGVQVADGCYLRNNYYREVMWPQMLNSELKSPGQYVYSDVSMYVMKEIIERVSAEPIQDLVQSRLYQSLGMYTAGFNPRDRFERSRMVPTEWDDTFRDTLLQGHVHDQGAAMAGGVAGHAGLFACANDLAIYGQLLLNRGEYGGKRYFAAETVDRFTSRQSVSSRRGLGFDKRELGLQTEYPSKFASTATFGHTGYTGTAFWVDPEKRLVFVFLSNRVHPEVSPKLSDLAIRRRVLDVIYESLNGVAAQRKRSN